MNLRKGPLPLTWQRILIYVAIGAAVGFLFPDASFLAASIPILVGIVIELGIWLLQRRR